MLTYLVVLLDDTSTSFCHYTATRHERRLIDLGTLRRAIVWAMKENLNIQFVYPAYLLPEDYRETVETTDHTKVGPMTCGEELDGVVVDTLADIDGERRQPYVWQCTLEELSAQLETLKEVLGRAFRINVMLTDVATWRQPAFDRYKVVLDELTAHVAALYGEGRRPQLNLLTDRLLLGEMNNCGAGDTCVTLAPDGRFYICPAFYYGGEDSIGSPEEGLTVPNRQLLRLDHAPICRRCDAYQCRRCVWLNGVLTGDCNTPSHEQCVTAHLERNASRQLQLQLRADGVRLQGSRDISEIDYLDPFIIASQWK